jgi:hypothetical protein
VHCLKLGRGFLQHPSAVNAARSRLSQLPGATEFSNPAKVRPQVLHRGLARPFSHWHAGERICSGLNSRNAESAFEGRRGATLHGWSMGNRAPAICRSWTSYSLINFIYESTVSSAEDLGPGLNNSQARRVLDLSVASKRLMSSSTQDQRCLSNG